MWWRIPRSQWERDRGGRNKKALKNLVGQGAAPGLLAYSDAEPVGWCSVGPRHVYSVLQRSRVMKPVDDVPVWSIVCFYIARKWRHRGVGSALVAAAVEEARAAHAPAIEGYPVLPRGNGMPDLYAFTGVPAMFESAGFSEISRRSETRAIYRLNLLP